METIVIEKAYYNAKNHGNWDKKQKLFCIETKARARQPAARQKPGPCSRRRDKSQARAASGETQIPKQQNQDLARPMQHQNPTIQNATIQNSTKEAQSTQQSDNKNKKLRIVHKFPQETNNCATIERKSH